MKNQNEFTEQKQKELALIDIPKISNDNLYESNLEKAMMNGNSACPCCGKEIKNEKYFINSAFGGMAYLSHDKTEYADCWVMAVGSECAKKFPKGYVFQK